MKNPISISPAQLAFKLANGHPDEAIRLLKTLIENNNIEAMLLLGQLYLDGPHIQHQPELALSYFLEAAKCGSAMGLNLAGRCYEHGWGTQKDASKAANYFLQAAERDLDWGMYNLANLYATGRGVVQSQQQAFALYMKAASLGHAKSMNLVGRYYQEGIAVSCDPDAAHHWYERSAQAGDFRGQISWAGVLLENGKKDQAIFWLRTAMGTANNAALSKLYPQLLQLPDSDLQNIGKEIRAKLLSAS